MLDSLTLKFWEPFFRAAKLNDGCPIKVVYGCPKGKNSINTGLHMVARLIDELSFFAHH